MSEDEPPVVFDYGPEDYRQAQWIADQLDGSWRFDHTQRAWFHWDGTRWAQDKTGILRAKVAELAFHRIVDRADPPTGGLAKALPKLFNLAPLDRALEALSTFPKYATDGSDWDQVPHLLGCENGIVDLRHNRLVENPTPDMLVTKTTGRTFRPCAGPEEFAERAPRFMKFMGEVMSDDVSMVSFLLLWFGASIFGFSPEQRFLLMVGIGRNGKGVLKHSIMKAVGEYGAQPDANVYMRSKLGGERSAGARADLMDLKGKRITFFSEPEGNRFNEEMLKAHTGGDLITARALYSNRVISWEPTHSITFLVNNAPEVEDLGPSMGARVMVADFRERYDGDKEDKQLYVKLEKEADGVLSILCWAAQAWYESFEADGRGITMPPRVIEQSAAFMARGDQIAQFLSAAMVVEHGAETRSSIVYERYLEWHARSDIEAEALSQTRFSLTLERRGFKRMKRMNANYVKGLRPKSAVEWADGHEEDEDEGDGG